MERTIITSAHIIIIGLIIAVAATAAYILSNNPGFIIGMLF